MDIRYSMNQADYKRKTTEELRKEFLIGELYVENQVTFVYSHVDRMVIMGCMPTTETVPLNKGIDVWKAFGSDYILQGREMGIFNLGGNGTIISDGVEYKLGYKDCLYLTKGNKEVTLSSDDVKNPAKYYMTSAPAHCSYKNKLIKINEAAKKPLGSEETSNKRTIYQFIHPDVLETCQLLMGLTALEEGNVWNTMPCHLHDHRMEVYMYFELPKDNVVFHMMGSKEETRHLVMHNYDAVISPSWSIHGGAGTSNYSFVWAMCGENKTFTDWEVLDTVELK